MSQRGIVATLGVTVLEKGFMVGTGAAALGPVLRRYATYWDRIDSPINNFISIDLGPEWAELVAAGVGFSSPIMLGGGVDAQILIGAQCAVFHERQKREPGLWSMAQMGSRLYVPEALADPRTTLEIELTNCLPVPDDGVPIEKILNFKVKRAAELAAFRATMDEIYQGVLSAGDMARAQVMARNKIDVAIAGVQRSMNDSFTTRYNSVMKFGYVAANALAGVFATELPIAARAIVGVGSAMLGLKIMSSPVPKGAAAGEFSYVQRVVEEVGR